VWDAPAPEFRLSRIRLSGGATARVAAGPEILLCTDGAVRVVPAAGHARVDVPRGAAAFVPASTGHYAIEGQGTVFRAATNL
jgi:mannose-6-phosphate isomerase class I